MNQKAIFLSITAFFLLFCSSTLTAKQSLNSDPETVIAKIGEMEITLQELTSYYQRNNLDAEFTASELREFLPFFVDYKMKLAYGYETGLNEDEELLAEFNEYAKQASISYWLERDVKERIFEEFVRRSNYEVRAFHILLRLDQQASPTQEREARQRLMEARQKYLDGTPIEELDSEYSTNVRGQSSGGALPWFSAGTTVREFEDALFELEPGEISEPVRTQFGYHLIVLKDKRDRNPDRLTSHIFIRSGKDGNSPLETANEAYQALQDGNEWDEVVAQYTEDGGSVANQGQIGWLHHGMQFTEQFTETVFAIDPDLPFTEPMQTSYGYHILRIDSVRTYIDEDQKIAELRQRMDEIPNYAATQTRVMNRVAEIGNFSVNQQVLDDLTDHYHSSDTTSIEEVPPSDQLLNSVLFTFNENEHTVSEFNNFLTQYYGRIQASNFSESYLQEYRDIVVEQNIIDLTLKHFPEFEQDIESYMNGLIVFRVSDDNLWNTATVDSSAVKDFYNEQADNYRYPERYSYLILASRSDSTLQLGIRYLEDRVYDPEQLRNNVPELSIVTDTTASVQDEPFSKLPNMNVEQVSGIFEYRNRNAVIMLKDVLEPRKMTFEEAFNRAASDYQPIREELFQEKLNQMFDVQIFTDRIN